MSVPSNLLCEFIAVWASRELLACAHDIVASRAPGRADIKTAAFNYSNSWGTTASAIFRKKCGIALSALHVSDTKSGSENENERQQKALARLDLTKERSHDVMYTARAAV